MAKAKIGTIAIVFDPMPAASAPLGALFLDSNNGNALTYKTPAAVVTPVSATSSADLLIKQMQNLSGPTILAGYPVAKLPDGSIVRADSDAIAAFRYIGIALDEMATSELGRVMLIGPNAIGVLAGSGFTPGDEVYFDEAGEYTNDKNSLDPINENIILAGYADCAAGAASATVADLIIATDTISLKAD